MLVLLLVCVCMSIDLMFDCSSYVLEVTTAAPFCHNFKHLLLYPWHKSLIS